MSEFSPMGRKAGELGVLNNGQTVEYTTHTLSASALYVNVAMSAHCKHNMPMSISKDFPLPIRCASQCHNITRISPTLIVNTHSVWEHILYSHTVQCPINEIEVRLVVKRFP